MLFFSRGLKGMKEEWWVLRHCDLYWMVLFPSMPLDREKRVWPALAFWLVSINHSSWLRSSPRAAKHDSLVTQHSQQQKEWSGTPPKSNCRRIFLCLWEMLWMRYMPSPQTKAHARQWQIPTIATMQLQQPKIWHFLFSRVQFWYFFYCFYFFYNFFLNHFSAAC